MRHRHTTPGLKTLKHKQSLKPNEHRDATTKQMLHLLLLHGLLLFAHVSEASLQIITALQSLLKLGLHVVYLKDLRAQNDQNKTTSERKHD